MKIVCVDKDAIWNMSVSIGIALAPRDGKDFNILYKKADIALYHTKRNRKNGFTVYGD